MPNPAWTVGKYKTSATDLPRDLGDDHIELRVEDCVLPYLSSDNAKRLADFLSEASNGTHGGKIEIGEERIEVSRQGT